MVYLIAIAGILLAASTDYRSHINAIRKVPKAMEMQSPETHDRGSNFIHSHSPPAPPRRRRDLASNLRHPEVFSSPFAVRSLWYSLIALVTPPSSLRLKGRMYLQRNMWTRRSMPRGEVSPPPANIGKVCFNRWVLVMSAESIDHFCWGCNCCCWIERTLSQHAAQ